MQYFSPSDGLYLQYLYIYPKYTFLGNLLNPVIPRGLTIFAVFFTPPTDHANCKLQNDIIWKGEKSRICFWKGLRDSHM